MNCAYGVLVAQSYSALCNPMDCSPPGSSVHGILQARILEWIAISFSRGSSWPRDRTHVSCVSCMSRQTLCRLNHKEMVLYLKSHCQTKVFCEFPSFVFYAACWKVDPCFIVLPLVLCQGSGGCVCVGLFLGPLPVSSPTCPFFPQLHAAASVLKLGNVTPSTFSLSFNAEWPS